MPVRRLRVQRRALRVVVRHLPARLLAVDARQDEDPVVRLGRLDRGLDVAELALLQEGQVPLLELAGEPLLDPRAGVRLAHHQRLPGGAYLRHLVIRRRGVLGGTLGVREGDPRQGERSDEGDDDVSNGAHGRLLSRGFGGGHRRWPEVGDVEVPPAGHGEGVALLDVHADASAVPAGREVVVTLPAHASTAGADVGGVASATDRMVVAAIQSPLRRYSLGRRHADVYGSVEPLASVHDVEVPGVPGERRSGTEAERAGGQHRHQAAAALYLKHLRNLNQTCQAVDISVDVLPPRPVTHRRLTGTTARAEEVHGGIRKTAEWTRHPPAFGA